MRRLVISALLFIPITCFPMSFNKAEQIYTRIAKSNGFRIYPNLVQNYSDDINASSSAFRITVNRGLLKFINNDNQMALVLGHELAHYQLGHRGSTIKNEYAADKLGAVYMQHAGYNKCAGAVFFKRLPYGDSIDHPASYKRIKALGC